MLAGVHAVFTRRDLRMREEAIPPLPGDSAVSQRWGERLRTGELFDESEGLALLAEHGIAVVPSQVVSHRSEAIEAASSLGFPVAVKTAERGIHH